MKKESLFLAPPRPDGNWEVTPRPTDALDDARITGSFIRTDEKDSG